MTKLFNNVYNGKRVFVTGHTGFKGSWLVLWLSRMGAEVIGYSLDAPTKPNHLGLLKLGITSIKGDLLDEKKLQAALKKYKPDIVFHLAAQAIVRMSYDKPVDTFRTNIIGTMNLLEACRKIGGIKAIVNVTSDKCYQNTEQIWGYREDDAMGGSDPYSASKGAAEILSQSYRKSFHMPIANVRAGNVIGGGDWAPDRLIPDIMKATNKGEHVHIRNPHATRPWQHVLEPLSGYLLVGARLLQGKWEYADNWNFGPTDAATLSVYEVTEHTKKHWDIITYKIAMSKKHPHEAHLLKLDSTKAHTLLRWKNIWDHHTTFEKTVNWYKNFYNNKMVSSEQDLEEYIRDAQKASAVWTKK